MQLKLDFISSIMTRLETTLSCHRLQIPLDPSWNHTSSSSTSTALHKPAGHTLNHDKPARIRNSATLGKGLQMSLRELSLPSLPSRRSRYPLTLSLHHPSRIHPRALPAHPGALPRADPARCPSRGAGAAG